LGITKAENSVETPPILSTIQNPRSPYGATVRRVRVLGQVDRLMVVEIVAVKDGDGAECLGLMRLDPELDDIVNEADDLPYFEHMPLRQERDPDDE
jgi:hypothetical protein